MKILVSQFCHETNTFAADRSDVELFKKLIWTSGEEFVNSRRGGTDYISGMMKKAEEAGVEIIPGFSAFSVGGLILSETYKIIKGNTLEAILRHKDELDGICISLHGAAVSEDIDDLELDILKALREAAPGVPITATFDLHGNIGAELVEHLDGLVVVKEYPHIDCDRAGYKAMELLIGLIKGEITTTLSHKRIPMLLPPATACTFDSPALDIKKHIIEVEEREKDSVFDISFFHGFPYADLPITGSSVVVTAKTQESAQKISEQIAEYIWDRRTEFDATDYLLPKDAVDKALTLEGSPIVINETSDNPGGGAPADGTHLLREMLERNLAETCFGFICDPEFVDLCVKVGVGNKVSGLLGGKTDNIHGEPVEVKDAYVKIITDGKYITSSPVFNKGAEITIGRSVRVQIGNVDVIVGSVRMQTLDDGVFRLHNINILDYKLVALKSTQHFRAVFKDLAQDIVTADPPGIHTANFSLLNYSRLKRPLYPLDNLW